MRGKKKMLFPYLKKIAYAANLTEPSRPGDQLLAHHAAALALQAQEAGLAVTVAHAALPLPPPVQWHACAHS